MAVISIGMIALIVLLAIAAGLLLVVLYVIGTYNVFVGLRNQIQSSRSGTIPSE